MCFESLNIPCMYVAPGNCLSAFSCAKPTALVIDIGLFTWIWCMRLDFKCMCIYRLFHYATKLYRILQMWINILSESMLCALHWCMYVCMYVCINLAISSVGRDWIQSLDIDHLNLNISNYVCVHYLWNIKLSDFFIALLFIPICWNIGYSISRGDDVLTWRKERGSIPARHT